MTPHPITTNQAACCLLSSAADVLTEHGLAVPDTRHRYLSAFGSYPYCSHDALIGRELGPTDINPWVPGVGSTPTERVWYERFELKLVRAGRPAEPKEGECIGELYGSCTDTTPTTISGHHNLTSADRRHLRTDLLEAWCACMNSHGRPMTWPVWIESVSVVAEGRFTGTELVVVAQLS